MLLFQRCRPQLVDDVNMYSTPQKLNRSLQSSSSAKFGDRERQLPRIITTPASVEVEWNPRLVLNKANSYQDLNRAVETRVSGRTRRANSQQIIWDAEPEACGKFPSCSAACTCMAICRGVASDKGRVQMVEAQRSKYGKAVLSSLFCLIMVFITVILFAWAGNDEVLSDVVPT